MIASVNPSFWMLNEKNLPIGRKAGTGEFGARIAVQPDAAEPTVSTDSNQSAMLVRILAGDEVLIGSHCQVVAVIEHVGVG
jgi:hypothetical protein